VLVWAFALVGTLTVVRLLFRFCTRRSKEYVSLQGTDEVAYQST